MNKLSKVINGNIPKIGNIPRLNKKEIVNFMRLELNLNPIKN